MTCLDRFVASPILGATRGLARTLVKERPPRLTTIHDAATPLTTPAVNSNRTALTLCARRKRNRGHYELIEDNETLGRPRLGQKQISISPPFCGCTREEIH